MKCALYEAGGIENFECVKRKKCEDAYVLCFKNDCPVFEREEERKC